MDRARVSKTVSKLGHQLTEVRHRALKTLLSDIRNKTITYEAILSDNSFVAHILNYIQTTECGDSELGTAIDLISELLLSPDVRRQFSCTDIRHILKRKLSQHQDESIQSRIQQIQSQLLYLPSEAPTIDTSVDELENMPPKLMKACLESRNERLEARKEWNQQGQRYLTIQEILNQERNPVPFAARLLQSIEVLAVDDQCLFEIGLKLRFSTDPNELAKAMENLCSLVDDLHPQTFIQKKTIPSAVVSLVSGGVKNSATTQLGCKFLQRFLTKLQSFLWDALDTEMYTHCKEKEKQVLCHDSHLSNSIPQSLILCDSSVGIDVVAFIAEFCAKLIKVVIEGADPLVEFLCITEAALMILIHPFCLDKEQQAHPLLSECLKKMVLYLHKSLNSCGPPENHDLLIDAKTQALASSVIRLLTKTKEVVQMDIEHIVPVLSILSNNFVARYLLPDFVELWIYYDAQVPKASPLKRGFQVEKEIRGVIKALDIIDSILKKDCGDRHWIERFPDIKAGLDWSKEPLCQNIINEVYQLILTNSESLLLEKSADVLRFILIEFSSNSTLEALTTFRNLLMEKVDAKASNWMFQILYSPGVVDVLFNEFVFLPELKSVVVELLELMWGHQTELFLKSIESRMWTLACFQQDPDFVNLLQKLPAERMMMLDQDWTVFSLRENRLSSSLCKMLSALLAQMKGIKCSHHFQSELLLLISKLLSTKESCSHFITTESEGEDLLTVLVSLWKSNEEQTQENVSMALRNLLAFNWTAKNAFLVMELHKKLIRRLQCKKETHRDDQLVADFSILQHLVVGYTPATDALLDEGILRTLKSYWSLIVANSDMRSKAIKLIKNMFISKPIDVLDQLSEDKRSCSLLVILLKELNPTQVDSQVLDLIAVFACEAKGTHLLLKNGLINKIKELLHFTLGHQQASLSSSIYKVLAAISAHENGRSALLTPRHAKEILKLIFHALSVTDISCRCDCYLFVRNLAFANKFTNYLLSQNGFIEKICEEIHPFYKEDCTSIQFQISTNALSVLWIMASYGEQAKGVIKSLLNWKKKKNVDSVRKNLEADPEMNQEDVQAANTFLCCLNSFAFVMES
eukprot:g3689.t1